MYFRFRRKPLHGSSKPSRSPSDAAGDVSSADSASSSSKAKGKNKARMGGTTNDNGDQYVVFEFNGHPYYPPDDILLDGELDLDEVAPPAAEEQPTKGKEKERKNSSKSSKKPKVAPGKPGELQCFFCSCRIYPTKNISMLDSFLELKVENERLRLMLKQMNLEDEENAADASDGASAAYHTNSINAELEMALRQTSSLNSLSSLNGQPMLKGESSGGYHSFGNQSSLGRGFSNTSFGTSPVSPKDSMQNGDQDSDDNSGTGDDKRKKVRANQRLSPVLFSFFDPFSCIFRKSRKRTMETTSAQTAVESTLRSGGKGR